MRSYLLLFIIGLLGAGMVTMIPVSKAQTTNDFTFAAVGDWGCTSNTNLMISRMNANNPDVVLGLGDYSYSTTSDCWHDILTSYPNIHDKMHLYNSVAFGNHEDDNCPGCQSGQYLTTTNEALHLAHWNQPPTYFSFDHKRVHFIALDTNAPYGVTSEQYAFVNQDLIVTAARTDVDWIVAFMHHTFYSSCTVANGCAANMTSMRIIYQPIFDAKGVDLVLQGHVHAYERLKPLESNAIITHNDELDYVNPEGQVYVTVGTGGRNLATYASDPEMSVEQIMTHGFLQVDITPTSLTGRFIDKNNNVLDSFRIARTPDGPMPRPQIAPPQTGNYNYEPAAYFDGTNYTSIASSSSLQLTKFSVATWFKLGTDYTSKTTKSLIVNKGGFGIDAPGKNMNYGIWVDYGAINGNKIEGGFEIASTGADYWASSPAKYNDGKWHYAVVTYDGSIVRLYIDGAQVASKSTTALPDNTGIQPLRIGMNSQALDRAYTGYADEVRIWNRAISTQEVIDQYTKGTFDTTGQVTYIS